MRNHSNPPPRGLDLAYGGKETEQCCSNAPIYEIVYSVGKKWLVCNSCAELDFFSSDIKEKVRFQQ